MLSSRRLLAADQTASERARKKKGKFPKVVRRGGKISLLATGKCGCREVRVYPTECGEQGFRDPSKNGSRKYLVLKVFFFFLGSEHFGTRPFLSPSPSGIRLYFVRPHFPSPNFGPGSKRPFALVQNEVALVQNRVWMVQKTRGKLFYLQLRLFTSSPLRPLLDALSHCKQKSSNCKQKS